MGAFIKNLIQIDVDRGVSKILVLRAGAAIDLSKVEPGVKSQTLTNLKRGHASSLSGEAYALYQVLAAVYDFPVFSVGRAERFLLSMRTSDTAVHTKVSTDLRAMWKLCNPEGRDYGEWWWHGQQCEGHRPGWSQFVYPRPKQMDLRALCHMLDYKSIFDVVPKQHTMRAAVALEQGEVIELTPYLERSS